MNDKKEICKTIIYYYYAEIPCKHSKYIPFGGERLSEDKTCIIIDNGVAHGKKHFNEIIEKSNYVELLNIQIKTDIWLNNETRVVKSIYS